MNGWAEPSRRGVLAGGLILAWAGAARAADGAESGAAGMSCTKDGIAGLFFEGEGGAMLRAADRWHIGSNTKAMTAALYARLVEHERCRWGATLPSLFPGMAAHEGWTERTVEELMAHAAGVTDASIDPAWLLARHNDRMPPRDQRRAFAEQVLAAPPGGPPGNFRYGNANYMLLGAAIEQAVGTDWETAMRAELFAPLGMAETGFGAPPREGVWGRQEIAGALLPVDPAGLADNPADMRPAGGVHLSPGDYARFLSAFLRDGAPLLRADTLARLVEPPRPGLRYAGGWALEVSPGAGLRGLSHSGSNTLWFAMARIDRAAGRAHAAFTNKGGAGGQATATRMMRKLTG